nr:hypothetical protein [Tanacetum cinerariifolium]
GLEFGEVVGEAFAHVVQQQVGVRADHLVGELRLCSVGRGRELRRVALLATGLEKQVLAGQDLRTGHVTARGHAQVAGVERDQPQDVVTDFRLAIGALAIGRVKAGRLRRCAVIHCLEARGQPHVAREGMGILLL